MKIIVAVIISLLCVLIAPVYFAGNIKATNPCGVQAGDVVVSVIDGSRHEVDSVAPALAKNACSVKIDGRWRFGSEFASE